MEAAAYDMYKGSAFNGEPDEDAIDGVLPEEEDGEGSGQGDSGYGAQAGSDSVCDVEEGGGLLVHRRSFV